MDGRDYRAWASGSDNEGWDGWEMGKLWDDRMGGSAIGWRAKPEERLEEVASLGVRLRDCGPILSLVTCMTAGRAPARQLRPPWIGG